MSNSGISPFAYYDPGTFTFKKNTQITKKYDGTLKINKTDKTIEFSITLKNK